jgi:hypothetical protein
MSSKEYGRESFLLCGGWGSSIKRNFRKYFQKLNASNLKDKFAGKFTLVGSVIKNVT